MQFWLVKTEPSTYSIDDLARDKKTTWDGVQNPLARIHLREMKIGDYVLVFHTGDERAARGVAKVARAAYPDPKGGGDESAVVVDLEFGAKWPQPVTLEQMKSDRRLEGWDLFRISRLSVVPMTKEQWTTIGKILAKNSG